jgi:hypothetical protein
MNNMIYSIYILVEMKLRWLISFFCIPLLQALIWDPCHFLIAEGVSL